MGSEDPKDQKSSGISLSELPDSDPAAEESLNSRQKVEAFKARKRWEKSQAEDTRAQTLDKLSNEEKLAMMSRQYEFDKKEPRFELVVVALIPVAIKYSGVFKYLTTVVAPSEGAENIVALLVVNILLMFETIFRFAEVITAGLMFLFPPLRSTRQRFVVSFEGLDLPIKLRLRPQDGKSRVKLRWEQIGEVVAVDSIVRGLEIRNHSHQSLGEMRWDLSKKDKKTVLKLLRRYVAEKHPLRRYVEQELK